MPKIRILVVDDAVVVRKLITETLQRDPDLEVVGTAPNGRIALQKIPQVNPDLLTLDLEMPELNGLDTLRELRKIYPRLPVILFSTVTERGAVATLEGLALGATDYVTKPANVGSTTAAIQRLNSELIPRIKACCRHIRPAPTVGSSAAAWPGRFPTRDARCLSVPSGRIEIVCIGTSTGGPSALATLFRQLPAGLPVPIVIVQHMPPMFTAQLAERLTTNSDVPCHEATHGQPLEPGHAYMAPGGRHLEVDGTTAIVRARLHDGPPENSCRPAVDVLFRSVAAAYGGRALGVVMTGMGQDGLRGSTLLRERGSEVIVQDEASSVIWGMPGYVAQAGLAAQVLPLTEIAPEIIRRARLRHTPLSHVPISV